MAMVKRNLNPSFDKNIKKSKSRRGEIFSFFSFLK
jgi:hypothetical protein